MNKVSLISLNLNEILIEENEVSSLLCMTKCHCWFPRAASGSMPDHNDGEGGRNASRFDTTLGGIRLLRSGKAEAKSGIVCDSKGNVIFGHLMLILKVLGYFLILGMGRMGF